MIGKQRLFNNAFAVFINRLTQSITTFILIIYIARILGPSSLGQYTLAFNYYFLFMTLASQGFKIFFTRELSRRLDQTPIYFVNGGFLQLITSSFGYVILALVVFVLPYKPETSLICYIFGLAIIPFSLSNVTEAIFQAREKMYFISMSTAPIYILRVLIMILAMRSGYGLVPTCGIYVISECLIFIIQFLLILSSTQVKWIINWKFISKILRNSYAFLAIEGIAVLKSRMLVIILSIFTSEATVGLYGSILQLMQPFEIIAHSLVVAVFPSMTKAVQLGLEKQRLLAEQVIKILLSVALPIIIGLFFVGGEILVFVYGDPEFAQGALALSIVALCLSIASFTRPLGYLLVANGFEKINLWEVVCVSSVGGFIGLFLIPIYSLLGAALTLLFMQIVGCGIYIFFVYKKIIPLRIKSFYMQPMLLSFGMLLTFLVLKETSPYILITLVIATIAYGCQLGALSIYTLGGPTAVISRFLNRDS